MLNRRPRRQVNQMNVVPYIDVMLVLLVIFMVTAPMFTPGVIDLPSVSRARQVDQHPVEIVLSDTGRLTIKFQENELSVTTLAELPRALRGLPELERPFVVSASQNLKYYEVLKVVDELHKAGIRRVALTVQQRG